MVLTKEELISSLRTEVRVLLHLAGKVDRSQVDYRPTAKQRSTLELVRYLAIMGPTQVEAIRAGKFDRPAMEALWSPVEERASAMSFDEAIAAIAAQSDEYARLLSDWNESEFRSEIDVFGNRATRGSLMVNMVLAAHVAYRTQLFCYLKSCGREELNTMNLWMGVDGPMG